jgi:predicted phosphohydrolase
MNAVTTNRASLDRAMNARRRLAITADLHWGSRSRGDDATRLLASHLAADPPDLLVLAGDIGAGERFDECLALFAALPCRKALVPGNHDIWVAADDSRGDSLQVYREHLPAVCASRGFHYLDHGPLVLTDARLAVVGSMNWYDYSWSLERLKQYPDWEERLRGKRFSRGRHNDAAFVRWPLDDVHFAADVVAALEQHLIEARQRANHVIVVTHHPPFYNLGFPRPQPPTSFDGLLWDALCGNRTLELLLAKHDDLVRYAFCGHTHRERQADLGSIRGYNIGGDYHYKRLLLLDWPDGDVESLVFGDPDPSTASN